MLHNRNGIGIPMLNGMPVLVEGHLRESTAQPSRMKFTFLLQEDCIPESIRAVTPQVAFDDMRLEMA